MVVVQQKDEQSTTKQAHPLVKKRVWTIIILIVLLLISSILSLMIGPVKFSMSDIWHGLTSADDSLERRVIWELRFPRLLIGMLVGACLAIAGAILQAIMRNPLADPGIIGVSSGAGIAAITIMIIFPNLLNLLPLAAFLGAFVTALLIYLIAWKGGATPVKIVLVGVAVNAIVGAGTNALMLLYSDRVQAALPWLSGGIAGVGWSQFNMIVYYAIAAIVISMFSVKHIRVLRLGDDVAKLLGHRVELIRFCLIVLSALLAGIAVSVSGLIGFVGLVVPHILRLIIGTDDRYLVPTSAIGGALIVVFADMIARTVFDPIELPVGILLAFLGGPFFLYLIQRKGDERA